MESIFTENLFQEIYNRKSENLKYTELKKQFGEPIKKSDYFLFANEMIKLTTVNPDKLNKIAPNSASKQDSLEYTFMIIYGDKKQVFQIIFKEKQRLFYGSSIYK